MAWPIRSQETVASDWSTFWECTADVYQSVFISGRGSALCCTASMKRCLKSCSHDTCAVDELACCLHSTLRMRDPPEIRLGIVLKFSLWLRWSIWWSFTYCIVCCIRGEQIWFPQWQQLACLMRAESLPLIVHSGKNLFTLCKNQCDTATLCATQQEKIAAYANSKCWRAEITRPWSVLILP